MNAPLILATRSPPEQAALIAVLEGLGYRALSAPMLTIERLARLDRSSLERHDAIALTSAAAARLAGEDLGRGAVATPTFCVGAATATAARAAGFSDVRAGASDAAALAEAIETATAPEARVLWPRAETPAHDLAADLASRGRRVDQTTLYRSAMAARLPDPAAQALADGAVSAVLLFSARAAQAFDRASQALDLSRLAAICMSGAVAAALPARRFAEIAWPETPTQDALIERLCAMIPAQCGDTERDC